MDPNLESDLRAAAAAAGVAAAGVWALAEPAECLRRPGVARPADNTGLPLRKRFELTGPG
jgi:hypothetical protein